MVIKEKIKQILRSKQFRLLILILVVALAVVVAIFIYKEVTKPSREELTKISDEASGLMAEDNYAGANEKLIEIYNVESDEAEKAYRAFDIGNNYQFNQNYEEAIRWFNIAKGHYEKAQDQNGVDEASQAIKAAEDFKKLKDKPIQESPVDNGN